MAVGFPTKANWAAGDVLTASAQDDLAGTVNLLSNANAASGSQLVSNVAGTSFAYQATPSASNPVLNSSMTVAQRGTSFSFNGSAGYSLDRWYVFSNPASTISRQVTNDTTNLPNIQYCARIQRNSGNASATAILYGQCFETVNSIPFAGKTVTMSFYARAGSNYSPTSNALAFYLTTGTGTDQNLFTAYTGGVAVISSTATLTTTWQRFTATATIASTATEMTPYFQMNCIGTAGTNDYFEVTGVQIDIGSVALPFRTYAATYQGELAACQRYYWRNSANATSVYAAFGTGLSQSASAIICSFVNPVPMRSAASSLDYSALYWNDGTNTASISSITINTGNSNSFITSTAAVTSFGTQYRTVNIQSNNSSSAYFGVSAEL